VRDKCSMLTVCSAVWCALCSAVCVTSAYWCVTSAVCLHAYIGDRGGHDPPLLKKRVRQGGLGGSLTRRWGLNPPKMCRPAALNDKFKALKLKLSNIGIRKQTSHEFNFEGSGTPTPQILKQIDATCLSL